MKILFCLGVLLIPISVLTQSTWLSERTTNTSAFLDPNEIQMFGSINGLLNLDISKNQYLPFGVGGSQSIVSKTINEEKAWEIFGEMGVFTQFEWVDFEGSQQRNMVNVDYKLAFSYARRIKKSTYRLRFFHVSSHLGDDFIIRNRIRKYEENKVNYEQLEFTYFRDFKKYSRYYLGVGGVIRPSSNRLPFSYQIGYQSSLKKDNKKWAWTYGINIEGMQELNFTPGYKIALGRAFFTESKTEPFRLVLEYYTGHLPYSQYEEQRIEWLGLGMYFYL